MFTCLIRLLLSFAGALILSAAATVTVIAADAKAVVNLMAVSSALENVTSITRPGRVGYATIWSYNQYIQCRRMLSQDWRCEAAGTLMQPSLKRILSPDRISRLEASGWLLEPAFGNYVRAFPGGMATNSVATAILEALGEVYGAKPETIETATDWVVDMPCPTRHGPTQNLAGMINDDSTMKEQLILTCAYKPLPELVTTEPMPSLAALQQTYRPMITAELNRLWINRTKRVFAIFDPGLGYVQCMPDTNPAGFYCEAQSEESYPALAALLDEKRRTILHDAGFTDPGETPNYWKRYLASESSPADVAGEILQILHEVYGYRGNVKLKIKTER